jgi:hypothetical protein
MVARWGGVEAGQAGCPAHAGWPALAKLVENSATVRDT